MRADFAQNSCRSSNQTKCLHSSSPFIIVISFDCVHRECVASCPKTTYEVSGKCVTCPLPCDECVADINNESVTCLSCVVGRYLVSIGNVTSCTGLCPDRHYAGTDTARLSQIILQILIVLHYVLFIDTVLAFVVPFIALILLICDMKAFSSSLWKTCAHISQKICFRTRGG